DVELTTLPTRLRVPIAGTRSRTYSSPREQRTKIFPRAMLMIRLLSALLVISCASTAFARWELRVCQDPNQLPFSNRAGEGFDNRIAALLAEEMGADLVSVWVPLEALEYVRSDLLY